MKPTSNQRRTADQSERGAILPVAMLLMTVLLLMSAIVVDIGRLSLERRADQTAADVAVISGAMSRTTDAVLIETVRASLEENLTEPFTTADLNTCGGDVLPAGWSTYTLANCISHDRSWTQLRVRVPPKSFPTAFALLAGLTDFEHSAFAQIYDRRKSNVLPFAITANASNYECLKTGAGNVPDPDCSGNTSGNFGVVTFGLWGNDRMGTTTDCNGTRTQFVTNVAQGIDHDLSTYGGAPHFGSQVVDTSSCGATPRPNSASTTTGNTPQNLGDGLFTAGTFPDGGPSRLKRVGGQAWFGTTSVAGQTVDDTPLWEFISPSLSSSDHVPESCMRSQFIGDAGGLNPDNDTDMTALPLGVANHLILVPKPDRMIKLLERCLLHYQGLSWDDDGAFLPADPPVGCGGVGIQCTGAVFGRNSANEFDEIIDLQSSARFGYAPQLTANSIPNGNTVVRIDQFRAVFLQRVYGGNCSPSGCPVTWDPGIGYSSTVVTGKASAVTAFVLPAGILPNGLSSPGALDSYGTNRFIELTR